MSKEDPGAAAPADASSAPGTAVGQDGAKLPAAPGATAPPEVYVYAVSGIAERKGRIPIWLWLTAVGLTIWGIYYLIVYWNPPPGQ